MIHVLVGKGNVVLGSHVVSNIMIHGKAKKAVEEGQVDLLGDLAEACL